MAIQIGQQLGSLQITALLGKGGMGEVYRARDTKLKRDVAIKVLPDEFSRDADRIGRFQREAEVLASLSHQNIAIIYDLQQADGTRFLVMELVEGETLADRIQRGRVPVDEALQIAKSICLALEAAHEKGIVHRDLKPANVKITPDGHVKVLDFGLAKARETQASMTLSQSPTLPSGSMPGMIIGTAAYMSPEQARGKNADARCDIWAFGCVLFEMLSGKQAFSGETVTDILAAVIHKEPDWSALPKDTPAGIGQVLRRCLQKDATRRLHSAADVRIEMEEALTSPAAAATGIAASPSVSLRILMIGATCLLAGAVLSGFAVWMSRPAAPLQFVSHTVISLPAENQFGGQAGTAVAFSPDGTNLAFISGPGVGAIGSNRTRQIYVRPLSTPNATALSGTVGAADLFFSPDGRWIGFFSNSDGRVKKISVSGGAAVTLCEQQATNGGAWAPDGTIVLGIRNNGGLFKVSDGGGPPQELTQLREDEVSHRFPQFLPDGKTVIFTADLRPNGSRIAAQRIDTGERKILVDNGSFGRYAPTGHLIYYTPGRLMAVPFDDHRLEARGTPVPVLDDVMASFGIPQFSLSSTGSLAYVQGGDAQERALALVWVDRNGVAQPLAAPSKPYSRPRLSPDRQRLAIEIQGSKTDIWIYDLARETLTPLTFDGNSIQAGWTADGKRVLYQTILPGGNTELRWRPADGSGKEETIVSTDSGFRALSVSPDGKWIVYHQGNLKTNRDIMMIPMDGERKPRVLLQTAANESGPALSPDGRWLAYASDESGRSEVYVQPFPNLEGRWRISTEGGGAPYWNPNGRELFYRNGNKMVAVEVTTQSTFAPGRPKVLFDKPYELDGAGQRPFYDVSLDGQRFLMMQPPEQQIPITQIQFVQNWFQELKQRVPVP